MASPIGNLRVMGFAGALTFLAVLVIAVPTELWSSYSCAAVGILVLTIVLPVIVPAPMSPDRSNDAQPIWLIGPLGSMHLGLLAVAVITLILGMKQLPTATWIGVVLWCGIAVFGYFGLRAATEVVQQAASQTVTAKEDARTKWSASLRQAMQKSESGKERKQLEELIEKIRYAANDRGLEVAAENEGITALVGQLLNHVGNQEAFDALIRELSALLVQREDSVRASRSRA